MRIERRLALRIVPAGIAIIAAVILSLHDARHVTANNQNSICVANLQRDLSRTGLSRVRLVFGARVEDNVVKRVWLTRYYGTKGPVDSEISVEAPALDRDSDWQAFEADLKPELYPEVERYFSDHQTAISSSGSFTGLLQITVFTDKCAVVGREWGRSPKSAIVASLLMGDLEGLKEAIAAGENVNAVDEDGNSPLIYAAEGNGGTASVRFLLERGANPNMSDRNGRSPLELAAIHDDVDSVRALLEARSQVNTQNREGQTPLAHAAFGSDFSRTVAPTLLRDDPNFRVIKQRAQIVQLLINSGANVNLAAHDGSTPLHGASFWGDVDTLNELLAAGADPNVRDSHGDRPLEKALKCIDGRGDACRKAVEILQRVTR